MVAALLFTYELVALRHQKVSSSLAPLLCCFEVSRGSKAGDKFLLNEETFPLYTHPYVQPPKGILGLAGGI